MRPLGRIKHIILLIVIVIALPFAWVTLFSSSGSFNNNELVVDSQLSELRNRLKHAEAMNQERELDLQKLRSQFNVLVSGGHTHGNSTFEAGSMMIPLRTQELLGNLSYGNDLRPPNIYFYLPHLIKVSGGLEPTIKLSRGRTGVSVVVGIPHVKRDTNYLFTTLNSLFSALSTEEKSDSLFIVFIGEVSDSDYIKSVCSDLQTRFPAEMQSGLLEVLVPALAYYPDFSSLKLTFGDPLDRVKWRTKQNLDFAYLMMYARMRGTYYLQLEDDVECKQNFVTIIKNFATGQATSDWVLLEFSHLGFIGKLFKSSDLPMVIEFILMFHRDKPIDWLLDHLLFVKVCNPEQDNKHCDAAVGELRRRYKPSLFQHIGMHSSLRGKLQKLKDRDFGGGANVPQVMEPQLLPAARNRANPPAQVTTTLGIYQHFTLDSAYRGNTVFWCTLPHAGDTATFTFTPPIAIARFSFTSGNPEHPGDKFFDTTVEVKLAPRDGVIMMDNNLLESHGYKVLPDGFVQIASFDASSGKAEGTPGYVAGVVEVMRLSVHSDSTAWVILSEITIEPIISNSSAEDGQKVTLKSLLTRR